MRIEESIRAPRIMYEFEARDKNGKLLWTEKIGNLVTTVGLTALVDNMFKASGYTAAWFLGLIAAAPTLVVGDTMASHAGWTEVVAYSESVRQTLTLGAAAAGSANNSASKAVFTINADGTTIRGTFLNSVSTKSGTTGTLYSEAAFAADRLLNTNDTLSITATVSFT